MSEIIAYAITHAPKGVKGGPYEARFGGVGTPTSSLREAERWTPPVEDREDAESSALFAVVRRVVPHARVIRIVRKVRPSEASAVAVLRELMAWDRWIPSTDPTSGDSFYGVDRSVDTVRLAGVRFTATAGAAKEDTLIDYGPDGRLGPAWVGFREAVDAYRKAGGK